MWYSLGILNLRKSYISNAYSGTCIKKSFSFAMLRLLRITTTGTLLFIRLSWRVPSWVDYSRQRNESCPVGTMPVILPCWSLTQHDVKNSCSCDSNLWIRKRVYYTTLHYFSISEVLNVLIRSQHLLRSTRIPLHRTKRHSNQENSTQFTLTLTILKELHSVKQKTCSADITLLIHILKTLY